MLKSNVVNRIIALIAALVIWAYVIIVENPPQTKEIRDVPVTLTNMDILAGRNLTVSSEASYSVSLTVSGKRSEITKLTAENFTATVDMRGWQRGERQAPVAAEGPRAISIIEIRPAKININFEDLISVSKPIKIEYTDAFGEGVEPGFIKLAPDQIEVSWAKSQVDGVSYIQVLIDINSLQKKEKVFHISPQPINYEGRQIYAPLKLSQSEVEVSVTLCKVKEIPIYVPLVGEPAAEYEIAGVKAPNRMKIRGTEDALASVSYLNADAINLSNVEVTSKIPISFKQFPPGVEFASDSENIAVEVNIKGISENEFTYSANEVEIENIRDGFGAHINDSSVKIKVYGTSDVIRDLKKTDIIPYVDLADIDNEEETSHVEVKIRCDKSLRKTVVIPEKVYVNLYEYYS